MPLSEKIRSIVFADYRIQNENVPQFRSGFFIVVAGVWSEKGKHYLGQKNCRGHMSEREKRHFGSKELSRAYGLKGKTAILGQKNCCEHMV